jgi:branched-chain amino acid transport system permease protein
MDALTTFLQVFATGILTGGVYALVGIGLSLVFGVMRVVNFAHGEFVALGMYLSLLLFQRFHLDPFLSILVLLPAIALLGYVIERVLIAPIIGAPEHMTILMTLGIGLVISNLLLLAFGGQPQSIYTWYSTRTLSPAGVTFSAPMAVSFLITVAVILGLYWLLMRTEIGRAMRATAQNRDAAELQGVDTARTRGLAFGIGVGLAAVAGAVLMPVLYVIPTVGGTYALKAFVVTVLSGMGNVLGAIGGGLILGITESLGAAYVSSAYRDAFGLVAFLIVLLVRPAGLFGKSRM